MSDLAMLEGKSDWIAIQEILFIAPESQITSGGTNTGTASPSIQQSSSNTSASEPKSLAGGLLFIGIGILCLCMAISWRTEKSPNLQPIENRLDPNATANPASADRPKSIAGQKMTWVGLFAIVYGTSMLFGGNKTKAKV